MNTQAHDQDYYDWWCVSDVCAGTPYLTTVHACLTEQLSAAGVVCVLIANLLERCSDEDGRPLQGEQSYPFDPEPCQAHRDIMAAALRAIGAVKLAARLSQPLSTAPDPIDLILDPAAAQQQMYERLFAAPPELGAAEQMQVETHAEVRRLVALYSERHKEDLANDLARHGDPRAAPGFNQRKARIRWEKLAAAAGRRYAFERHLPRLQAELRQVLQLLVHEPSAEAIQQQTEVLTRLRDSFAEYEHEGLSAAGREWFRQVREVLRAPTGPTTERRRRRRPRSTPGILHPALAALGPFAMEDDDGETWVEWTSPTLLPAPIEHWSLRLTAAQAASDDTAGAWQLLQSRLGEMLPAIRESLVRGFCEGGLEPPNVPATIDNVLDEVAHVVIERGPDDAWTLSFRLATEEEHRWEIVVNDHGVVCDSPG